MLKAGNEDTSKTSMDVVQVFFLDFEQEPAGLNDILDVTFVVSMFTLKNFQIVFLPSSLKLHT